MASDYRSSPFLHNSFNNSFKSNAFDAPRTGSLRLKACEATNFKQSKPPTSIQHIKQTEHVLNTVNLLKTIVANQSQKNSTSMNAKPMASSLGNNKSYYSSTCSFTSKIVDRSKLPAMQHQQVPKSQANGIKSTASSSGTSSVESIMPKYNGFLNGSKKRIYSSVRITKKELPYTAINKMPTSVFINNSKFIAAANEKKEIKDSENNLEEFSNKNNNAFSTKFPHGMPFEDEFYHKCRNSFSAKSEVSDYGSFENDDSDRSLLPFEEEFTRQRPSNDSLYVDFSKRFSPILPKSSTKYRTNKDSHISNGNAERKFNYSPKKVNVQDQPVVYVAVKWWASESNHDCCSDPIRTNVV